QFCGVTGDRETDALCRPNHCCVYTHYFASRINQWSTRVAGIQRGISLNNIVDQAARLRMHRAAERADYASSDTRLKAEWISDRDHKLTHTQILRVGQAHVGKLRRIDSNHSAIAVPIGTRNLLR